MTRTLIAFRALSVRSRSLSCSYAQPAHGCRGPAADAACQRTIRESLSHYLTYLRDLRVFERVYEQHNHDLRRTLDAITAIAEDAEQPFEAVRSRVRPSVRLRQQPASPL